MVSVNFLANSEKGYESFIQGRISHCMLQCVMPKEAHICWSYAKSYSDADWTCSTDAAEFCAKQYAAINCPRSTGNHLVTLCIVSQGQGIGLFQEHTRLPSNRKILLACTPIHYP